MKPLLLTYLPQHRYCADTGGGEWAGPCPFCGSGDDRFRVWPGEGKCGRYWCRRCEASGDGIQLVRELTGCAYEQAGAALHLAPDKDYTQPALPAAHCCATSSGPDRSAPPNPKWQHQLSSIGEDCASLLWSDRGAKALKWLKRRGFTEDAIREAEWGYNPTDVWIARSELGLEPGTNRKGEPVYKTCIPQGITIPWKANGQLWRLNVRRSPRALARLAHHGKDLGKYGQPAGARNALYGADTITPKKPVILCEGEFNAVSVKQAAGDLVTAVATGSTCGARRPRWIALLALPPRVLIGFDQDGPDRRGHRAGEEAAAYWLNVLPHASAWFPPYGDVNDLLRDGGDEAVRSWVQAGLNPHLEQPPLEAPKGSENISPLGSQDVLTATWGGETASHLRWFLQEAIPPDEPFQLEQSRRIMNPMAFFCQLHGDIMRGPQGPRARTGVLQEDLRLLYHYVMHSVPHETEKRILFSGSTRDADPGQRQKSVT